jgi:hypothetical protein
MGLLLEKLEECPACERADGWNYDGQQCDGCGYGKVPLPGAWVPGWDDLNRMRQWFNAIRDVNPTYLEPRDYQLAERLHQAIGMEVPKGIADRTAPNHCGLCGEPWPCRVGRSRTAPESVRSRHVRAGSG